MATQEVQTATEQQPAASPAVSSAPAVSTATQNRRHGMVEAFKQKLDMSQDTLRELVPSHVPWEQYRAAVITTVAYNPTLLEECSPASLLQSVAEAMGCGLSLNRNLKEGDILPVWSPRGTIAQFRPRAIGLMKLCRQSGDIVDIWAHEVRRGDHYVVDHGMRHHLEHTKGENRGDIYAAYCCWKMTDGTVGFEDIDLARIDKARAASEGYKAFKAGKIKSTPWVEHESEMVRKTAVIAGSKWMPKSTENLYLQKALKLEAKAEGYEDYNEYHGVAITDAGKTQVDNLAGKIGATAEIKTEPKKKTEKKTAEATKQNGAASGATAEGPAGPNPPPVGDVVQGDAGWGDKPAETKPVDWVQEAKDLRGELIKIGTDKTAFEKWLEATVVRREALHVGNGEWSERLAKEIAARRDHLK